MNTSRLLLILFHLVSLAAAQSPVLDSICVNTTGNYTSNSRYKTNLDTLFSSINSNNQIDYGFYNFSAGQSPDQVEGIALCRGDVTVSNCRSCINDATHKLKELCPNQKEAILWYDNCMLRYTNRSIFGVMEEGPYFWMWNLNNVTDVDQFFRKLGDLLSGLQSQAASGDSRFKFATGEVQVTDFQKIYALVQCTPDLNYLDCFDCLSGAIGDIPKCCYRRQGGRTQGGRVYRPSCNFRYEVDKFYDSPTAPTPPPPSGHSCDSSKVVILAIVPTVVSVVPIAVICYCIIRRKTLLGMGEHD